MNWACLHGIEKVREITRLLLSLKVRPSNFYRLAISLEMKSEPNDSTQICRLFDECIQSDKSEIQVWMDYIKYKVSIGDINGACHIASKAKREVQDQDNFIAVFEELRKSF